MNPREPDNLEGWTCADQLSIEDLTDEDQQEDA